MINLNCRCSSAADGAARDGSDARCVGISEVGGGGAMRKRLSCGLYMGWIGGGVLLVIAEMAS